MQRILNAEVLLPPENEKLVRQDFFLKKDKLVAVSRAGLLTVPAVGVLIEQYRECPAWLEQAMQPRIPMHEQVCAVVSLLQGCADHWVR